MPIVVQAVAQEDFDKWVIAQKKKASADAASSTKTWSPEELLARGKQVYQQCAACHGPNGEGVGPFPKLAGSPFGDLLFGVRRGYAREREGHGKDGQPSDHAHQAIGLLIAQRSEMRPVMRSSPRGAGVLRREYEAWPFSTKARIRRRVPSPD